MKKIIQISPFLKTKGGISTVVQNYFQSDLINEYRFTVIESHSDGSKLKKIFVFFKAFGESCLHALFKCPDLVHVHMGDFPSPYRKILLCFPFMLGGIPCILHFHGAGFMDQFKKQHPVGKRILLIFFKKFSKILCLSESWKEVLAQQFKLTNLSIVRNSVPLLTIHYDNHNESSQLKILFLGSIGDRKGIFELLDVIEILIAAGYDIKLAVGGNGDVGKLLHRIDHGLLKGCVRYLGWVTGDVREREFLAANVFCLPSHAEGMPMSILEAMSYGLPIISTKVGGIPEMVDNAVNGFLIDPGSVIQLEEAIRNMASNVYLRQKMSKKSLEIIQDRFCFQEHVDQIRSIYNSSFRG